MATLGRMRLTKKLVPVEEATHNPALQSKEEFDRQERLWRELIIQASDLVAKREEAAERVEQRIRFKKKRVKIWVRLWRGR